MKAKKPKETSKQRALVKQVLKQLNAIDWDKFDAKVRAICAPEIEAYRRARARSEARMRSGNRFICAAA